MRGQQVRDAAGQGDLEDLAVLRQGEHLPAADERDLSLHAHEATEEVDVLDRQPEGLAWRSPSPVVIASITA